MVTTWDKLKDQKKRLEGTVDINISDPPFTECQVQVTKKPVKAFSAIPVVLFKD